MVWRSRASAWSKAAAISVGRMVRTDPDSHLALAQGSLRGSRDPRRPPGGAITSCGRRLAGSASSTAARAAIRLRFGFSPDESRVRIFPSRAAAFAVAARGAPGSITIPLRIGGHDQQRGGVHGSGIRAA